MPHCFFLSNQRYPQALTEIQSPTVLIPPKADVHYRKTTTGFVLWSSGQNGINDNGDTKGDVVVQIGV